MGYVEGTNREQVVLFPAVIDDYVSAENPVRFVEAFVKGLDLVALGFSKAEPEERGRPAYDPRDLLKLYMATSTRSGPVGNWSGKQSGMWK
jgi:transposase